ncbi:MAG: SBBP repeat-containing protein [Ignavibacteriae bacterium]|nr:SBBP repeat-containing protein [Ignavibacteriota bacterium]
MVVDKSGNVYVTGYTRNSVFNPTDEDFLTIKYNSSGILEWSRTYDGPDWNNHSEDRAYALVVDDSGNVYVTGYSQNTGGFITLNYLTIKYNSLGDTLWTRRYSGNFILDISYSIALDDSNNVYVTGYGLTCDSCEDYVTIKYNTYGDLQWNRNFDGLVHGADIAYPINVDKNGNVYVTGYSRSFGNEHVAATIKYDRNGIEKWRVSYDSTTGFEIEVDDSGNVYIGGNTYRDGNFLLLIKYDSSGVQKWVKQIPGAIRDLVKDDSGHIYVAGSVVNGQGYDYLTIKFNSNGDSLWTRRYDAAFHSSDDAASIAVDKNNNVYVTGSSDRSLFYHQFATIKYSPLGTQQWVINYSLLTFGDNKAVKIKVDTLNNIIVSGYSVNSSGYTDFVTIKYSPITDVSNLQNLLQDSFELNQNYPNPFNPITTIGYMVKSKSEIKITVYNSLGKLVARLVNKIQEPGRYETTFKASNLSSGIYFYNLEINGSIFNKKKLLLIK